MSVAMMTILGAVCLGLVVLVAIVAAVALAIYFLTKRGPGEPQ